MCNVNNTIVNELFTVLMEREFRLTILGGRYAERTAQEAELDYQQHARYAHLLNLWTAMGAESYASAPFCRCTLCVAERVKADALEHAYWLKQNELERDAIECDEHHEQYLRDQEQQMSRDIDLFNMSREDWAEAAVEASIAELDAQHEFEMACLEQDLRLLEEQEMWEELGRPDGVWINPSASRCKVCGCGGADLVTRYCPPCEQDAMNEAMMAEGMCQECGFPNPICSCEAHDRLMAEYRNEHALEYEAEHFGSDDDAEYDMEGDEFQERLEAQWHKRETAGDAGYDWTTSPFTEDQLIFSARQIERARIKNMLSAFDKQQSCQFCGQAYTSDGYATCLH